MNSVLSSSLLLGKSQIAVEQLKRVAGSLNLTKRTKNGVYSYPHLECVELERYVIPVLYYVTLGLAGCLLKDTADYADLLVERTPLLLQMAPTDQSSTQARDKQTGDTRLGKSKWHYWR
jgi:hypothetical protein